MLIFNTFWRILNISENGTTSLRNCLKWKLLKIKQACLTSSHAHCPKFFRGCLSQRSGSGLVMGSGTTKKEELEAVCFHSASYNVCPCRGALTTDDRIGHEREPPLRVQPAEVTASQSSSTHSTEKSENRHEYHIETRPTRTPVEKIRYTSFCHVHMFLRHSASY